MLNGTSLLIGSTDIHADPLFIFSIFFTSMTSHVSVFYNTVVVVVRTINLLFPFYKTKNAVLKLSFVVYPIIWAVITVMDLGFCYDNNENDECSHDEYIVPQQLNSTDHPAYGVPITQLVPITGKIIIKTILNLYKSKQPSKKNLMALIIIICFAIPYALPAIICVVCFVIQAGVMMKKGGSRNKINSRITMTVFYLTLVFFICNATFFIHSLIFITNVNEKTNLAKVYTKVYTTAHLTGVILAFINSALNPIILIIRGRDLKTFIRRYFGFERLSARMNPLMTLIQPSQLFTSRVATTAA